MNDFQKRIEEFRSFYWIKYNVKLDDEVLFFFIRVNDLQMDLQKQIKEIPELKFKTGWDYFMYGLGKLTIPSIIICLATVLILFLSNNGTKENSIKIKDGVAYLQCKQNDTTYYLRLKTSINFSNNDR